MPAFYSGYAPVVTPQGQVIKATDPGYAAAFQQSRLGWPATYATKPAAITPTAAPTPGTTVTPATPSNYSAPYGGIPQVPSYAESTKQAVDAYSANADIINTLAAQINAFNLAQQKAQYEQGFPGYNAAMAQSSADIQAGLAGDVPQSVKNELLQAAAERGVARGTAGAPFNEYDYLRSLGINALSQQAAAQGQLTSALGNIPKVALFNPSQFMVSPEQVQQSRMAANLYAAAPIPAAAAAANIAAAGAGVGAGRSAYIQPGSIAPSMPSVSIPSTILQRYGPTAGITAPAAPVSTTPGQWFPMQEVAPTPGVFPGTVQGANVGSGEGGPIGGQTGFALPDLFDFLNPSSNYPNYVEDQTQPGIGEEDYQAMIDALGGDYYG